MLSDITGVVGLGPWEIVIVLVIVLLIFGPKRLPELGRSLGGGMRSFKEAVTGRDDDRDRIEPPAERAEARRVDSAQAGDDAVSQAPPPKPGDATP